MKALLLLRHAKSDWGDPSLSDFDRPLAKRGRKAAPRMGRIMAEAGWQPDLVFCSAACRAHQTWKRVAKEIDDTAELRLLRGLYLASPVQILRQVRRAPDGTACLLVIGHNPGLERLALRLAGAGSSAEPLARLAAKFPTAALARFEVDLDGWRELDFGSAKLTHFHCPRDFD